MQNVLNRGQVGRVTPVEDPNSLNLGPDPWLHDQYLENSYKKTFRGKQISYKKDLTPVFIPFSRLWIRIHTYSEYGPGSTEFLNTDPIWIRIHNSGISLPNFVAGSPETWGGAHTPGGQPQDSGRELPPAVPVTTTEENTARHAYLGVSSTVLFSSFTFCSCSFSCPHTVCLFTLWSRANYSLRLALAGSVLFIYFQVCLKTKTKN